MSAVGTQDFSVERRGEVRSVENFLREIFSVRHSNSNRKLWYRGHDSAEYKLRPSIGREHKYAGKKLTFDEVAETKLLNRFRRRAYPQVGRAMAAGEAIFVARH